MGKMVLTVLGARPQFIKAAVVSRQLAAYGITERIVHTGQHFDANMSEVFFREMDIPSPAYNLNINSLGHGAMTGRMLELLERIIPDEKPDAVIVYGDTNSTIAGALAARKLQVRVVHVEAGLRSFNMAMPEEVNRVLTDRISNLLFCPTETAVRNLRNEGMDNFDVKIMRCGDVMQDAAYYYFERAKSESTLLQRLNLRTSFVLATLHRQENTDNADNLRAIIEGLNRINRDVPVIMPLHPRTAKLLERYSLKPEFRILEPVSYFDMLMLLDRCKLVVTDSGGLQKEAFFFGKHCITMREQTEWVELVENGFNILVGADATRIYNRFIEMADKRSDFSLNLYGNGKAANTIASELYRWL